MHRSYHLDNSHFASKWTTPTKEEFYNYEETNKLGIKYALMSDGPDKEDLLLQLLQFFHSYIEKYVQMIVKGHLPPLKSGSGLEATKFLNLLSPKGNKKISDSGYGEICRTLHLAFKQSTTEDIYDNLLLCLMRAIKKYDPKYVEKLRKVCDIIDSKCKGKRTKNQDIPEFTADEITKKFKSETTSYLRKLVKREHLKSITNTKNKVIGYRRVSWPPPPLLFKGGPVGFTYATQTYFRFYLHEYISRQMHNIESKEGVLQLEHRGSGDQGFSRSDAGVPNSDGAFKNDTGQNWAADTTLMYKSLDISQIDPDWVYSTNDKLFRNMSRSERNILYLIYVKEYSIVQIADIMGVEPKTVRIKRDEILTYLKNHMLS